MTSHFDESEHPRQRGGQFATKTNDSPSAELGAPFPTFSPADVRNADWTIDVLRDVIVTEGVSDFGETGSDDEGNAIVEWSWRSMIAGHLYRERIRIDDAGEVIAKESQAQDGQWYSADPYGDEAAALRFRVNATRLAVAGVIAPAQEGDGPYGPAFVGGLVATQTNEHGQVDATKVSQRTRAGIKKAIEWGALPGEYTYRVTTDKYSMGQSVRVQVEGMPDERHYVERQEGFPRGESAHAREVDKVLELIGNQWNTDRSDSMQDYFDVTYYLQVSIDDEHTTAWRRQQRELNAAKRRAAKAGV